MSASTLAILLLVVAVALLLRTLAALDYGRDWYAPGSFTLVNFDEAGSCRAALDGFGYSPFVGWQTLALASRILDHRPDVGVKGDAKRAKAFCHGEVHLRVARLYSAAVGALSAVALFCLGVQLFPQATAVPLLAAALLALSGWHISESLTGTVDAASTFFIYAFLAAGFWARRLGGWRWLLAAALLGAALFTKYWVFALASVAALCPAVLYARLFSGVSRARALLLLIAYAALFGLVCNPAATPALQWCAPLAFYLLPPWLRLSWSGRVFFVLSPWLAPLAMQLDLLVAFTAASVEGRFGTDYGAIGWNKPLRNLINVPLVLTVGMGLPAFLFACRGLRTLWRKPAFDRAWLVLMPLPAFALYMLFLAPVTYYRHYLPLLPLACLLAAVGVAGLASSRRRIAWGGVLLAWQALLALDLVTDYHFDPRRDLPLVYAKEKPRQALATFYVNPPPRSGALHRIFRPPSVADDDRLWRNVDMLLLSENWYDVAFANELNGPLVRRAERLIKTTPSAVSFYRKAVRGEHPKLEKIAQLRAPTFMPELLLHRAAYGSFTQFVGDIQIYRVSP